MQIIRARVEPFQQEINNDTDQRAYGSRRFWKETGAARGGNGDGQVIRGADPLSFRLHDFRWNDELLRVAVLWSGRGIPLQPMRPNR